MHYNQTKDNAYPINGWTCQEFLKPSYSYMLKLNLKKLFLGGLENILRNYNQ